MEQTIFLLVVSFLLIASAVVCNYFAMQYKGIKAENETLKELEAIATYRLNINMEMSKDEISALKAKAENYRTGLKLYMQKDVEACIEMNKFFVGLVQYFDALSQFETPVPVLGLNEITQQASDLKNEVLTIIQTMNTSIEKTQEQVDSI